jgi:hypothetical protein
MNLKNIVAKLAAKQAVNKILPMDGTKPVMGKKAKAAALLGAIAAVATAGAQFLGG